MVKSWPENNEPLSFDNLTAPLRKAFQFAYTLKRKNEGRSIPWTGPDQGKHAGYSLHPTEQLSAENLRYSDEEQGRDALEELLGLALRLGIEQGRRITMTGSEVRTLEIYGKIGKHLSREALMIRSMADAPRDGSPINIRLRGEHGETISAMRWRDGVWGERWYAASDFDNHMDASINDLPPEEADWSPIRFGEKKLTDEIDL